MLLAAACVWLLASDRDAAPGSPATGAPVPVVELDAAAPLEVAPGEAEPPATLEARDASDRLEPPDSLVDTEPDGALRIDGDGRFVADLGARLFFDYFLTATGERSVSELRSLIVREIEARLPPAAAAEAIRVLDAYLSYRRAARRMATRGEVPETLSQRLEALRALRRDRLGAELAESFFGTEERMAEADLARREILADDSLAEAERDHRLWEIEQSLPPAVREARARASLPSRLRADEAALREAGGSDEEVRALREQMVGAAAADRLAELDRERTAWQARLESFRAERAAIEADARIDAAERDRRIDELLADRFTATERLRVEAIERFGE